MIKIAGLSNSTFSETQKLKNNYSQWRKFRKDSKENYFIIPKELENYLPHFYNRALNLYLYYCFKAKNETGESWHAVTSIAENLGVTPKSINNWNKLLEDAGLIVRKEDGHFSKTTFLLPLSNYYTIEKDLTLDEYLKTVEKEFDGDLKAIFHLFEWRKSKSEEEESQYDDPYNVLCCVFERSYTLGNKTFSVNKYVLIEEKKLKKVKIKTNAAAIYEHIYKYSGEKVTKFFNGLELSEELGCKESFVINSQFNLTMEGEEKVLKLLDALNDSIDQIDRIATID